MKIWPLASIGCYVLACCLPALEWTYSNKPPEAELGIHSLAIGWLGILAGVVSWYANPFWLTSVILLTFRKWGLAIGFGALSCVLALSTFLYVGDKLPGDEGGVTTAIITRLLPGAYVWLASLIIVPIGAAVARDAARRNPAWLRRGPVIPPPLPPR